MRILLIEDDSALASYICKGLEAEHYVVDVALDGEQGALMATDLDYDLLILDLNLPGLRRHLRPVQRAPQQTSATGSGADRSPTGGRPHSCPR